MNAGRWGTAGVLMLAAALGGCTVNVNTEGVTAQETHTFTVGGAPTVTLDTFDGSIQVHSWDRAEIEVVVEKQAQDDGLLQQITVEKSQDGDHVTLRVQGPARGGRDGIQIGVVYSPSARLRVAVPRTSTLDLRSGDGSITIEDVSGAVNARSADGSITGLRVAGDLRARTDDGSIRLREVNGRVDVETIDGSVVVEGVVTHLRAKSGDGSMRVTLEQGSAVAADWLIETDDGSVEVRLPKGLAAEVDASTGDGRIRSSYPGLDVPGRSDDDDRGDRRTLKATLGGGGAVLRVRSGDGSIRFES
ncbi:MAG: DUF4097 family beta strand repeat-containing protein [Vicinamibacterales bacterium]